MAVEIERLAILIEANTKSYENAMKRLEEKTARALNASTKSTQTLNKAFGSLGITMSSIGKGLVVGAISAAAVSIAAMAGSAIKTAAAIGDLADKLGISTDDLQNLQFGAVQANMSFEDLEKSLLRFSKSLGQARNGQGDLLKTLKANGFDIAKIKAMSYMDALRTFADLVRNARNQQDKMLLNTQAFGKGSDPMLEFLHNGSKGLNDFAIAATTAGNKIKEGLVRTAQEIDAKWDVVMLRMGNAVRSFALSAVAEFDKMVKDFKTGGLVPAFETALRGSEGITRDREATRDSLRAEITQLQQDKADLERIYADTPNALADANAMLDGVLATRKAQLEEVLRLLGPAVSTSMVRPEFPGDLRPPKKTVMDGSGDEEAAKAAEHRAQAIAKVIEQLQFENIQMDRGAAQQRIYNELEKAGVDLHSEQGQKIAALVQSIYNKEQALDAATAAEVRRQDAERETIRLAQEAEQVMRDSMMALGEAGVDAFDRIILQGEKLKDVLADLTKMLASSLLRGLLLGQGPFAGPGGGFFGHLFKAPSMSRMGAASPRFADFNSGGGNQRGNGANGFNLQIIDQRGSGAKIKTETSRSGVKMWIRDAIASELPGALDRIMPAQFGLQPKTRMR